MKWKANYLSKLSSLYLILLLIFLVPISVSKKLAFPAQDAKFFVFTSGLLILSVVLGLSFFFKNIPKKIILTPIDTGLFLFLVYTYLRLILFNDVKYVTQYWELTGLVMLFVIIRNVNQNDYSLLFVTVLIAGIVQAGYGNLQLYRFLPSHHNLFELTGSFFNPGPFAGYLLSVLSVAVCIYTYRINLKRNYLAIPQIIQTRNNLQRTIFFHSLLFEYIPLATIVAILLVLPASKSRAAWLGAIVAVFYLLSIRSSIKDLFRRYFRTRFKKAVIVLLLMILIVGGV